MSREEKNQKIRCTLKQTKEKHSNMDCKVFECKVVSSKLNKFQREAINTLFREAKWLFNYVLDDVKDKNRDSARKVPVKVKDNIEYRELTILGSQIKQSIRKEALSNIKALSSLKKRGAKVGKINFKSYCNSIPLKQFGTTYNIDFNHNRIRIQNIKKPFYVRGLKQIPSDADITNAKFVRKPNGLYFYITCFVSREYTTSTNKQVGADFGIEHNLTLSTGDIYDISIIESKGVKLASKRLNKALKHNNNIKSANHYKRINKLKIAYQKDINRRKHEANKIIHDILNNYDFIAIQDEMISNWHKGWFGKQVQHSAMGIIKAKLKKSSKVFMVERSFPSTQVCPSCGCLTKHPLIKRYYDCSYCGFHHSSRDVKSAQSILDEALKQVSMERRTNSLVELKTSTIKDLYLDSKSQAVKQEAQVF